MGHKVHAILEFSQPFKGTGKNDKNCMIKIGTKEKEAGAYDLLLMALGSCLYATFEDILIKKKIPFEKLEIDLSGEKRNEIPKTLEYCNIVITTKTESSYKVGFTKALELACKYCSIYNTLAHVAKMEFEIKFI